MEIMTLLTTMALIAMSVSFVHAVPASVDSDAEENGVDIFPSNGTEWSDIEMYVTPSNGSLDDILLELHVEGSGQDYGAVRYQRQACFNAGPYGGSGGGSFNEQPDNCRASVSRIYIAYGHEGKFGKTVVTAIRLTYRYSSGHEYTHSLHGRDSGVGHTITLFSDRGEEINGIIGRSGAALDEVGFITNWGRIFGPYGECGGTRFHVSDCHLRGIFGRSGWAIDSLGFYCGN